MADLTGKTVAVVASGAEDGQVQGLNHIDKGRHFSIDKTLEAADIDDYDALVLPGGAINADQLRMEDKAREWVNKVVEQGKPLAAICHAPWVLASAGLTRGRKLTSFFTIQDDLRGAGAEWTDEAVVIDGTIITSRKPDDIPAFNHALISMMGQS